MSAIVWEEPSFPESDGRVQVPRWQVEAGELRSRPGDWALLCTKRSRSAAKSMAHDIKTGVLRAFLPAGSFTAVSRKVDGEFRVYARYVGEVAK